MMWKFQDFSDTQILCEINFGEYRSSKTAVFAFLGLWTLLIWPSKSAKIHEKSKFRAPKCVEMADFALLESPKLISHKIWGFFSQYRKTSIKSHLNFSWNPCETVDFTNFCLKFVENCMISTLWIQACIYVY